MPGNFVRFTATLKDDVSKGLTGIERQFDQLTKSKGASSFAAGFGLAGGIGVFNLATQALDGVVNVIGDSIHAASDLNETISKTDVVFGSSAASVETWGKTAATSMGLSENAALSAAASIGNLLLSTGTAKEKIAPMSESLVQLASDLASFNNIDPTEALAKLQSGIVGQERPLRELGVAISAASVDAKALELGFQKVNGVFTEGEKVQARYALIFEQTSTAQGDFARTSTELAGSQRILNAELADESAILGEKLLPVQRDLVHAAVTAVPAVGALTDALGYYLDVQAFVLSPLGNLRDGLDGLAEDAGLKATPAIDTTTGAMKRLGAEFADVDKSIKTFTSAEDDAKDATDLAKRASDQQALALKRAGDAAKLSAPKFDSLTSALDSLADAIANPAELAGENTAARIAIRGTQKDLRDLEKAYKDNKIKTREYGDQKSILTGQLATERAELQKVIDKQAEAGSKPAKDEISAWLFKEIARWNKLTQAEKDAIYYAMQYVGIDRGGPNPDKKFPRRASGGAVFPGVTYQVNEQGDELLTMGSQTGWITPAGTSGGGPGGGVNISITMPTIVPASTADLQRAMQYIVPELTRELRRQHIL